MAGNFTIQLLPFRCSFPLATSTKTQLLVVVMWWTVLNLLLYTWREINSPMSTGMRSAEADISEYKQLDGMQDLHWVSRKTALVRRCDISNMLRRLSISSWPYGATVETQIKA
jgi:hypothetical protein